MEWLKKHADTVVVLGGILTATLWMNSRFNEVDQEIGTIKTEMAVMKAVLIMKKVMPTELAVNKE